MMHVLLVSDDVLAKFIRLQTGQATRSPAQRSEIRIARNDLLFYRDHIPSDHLRREFNDALDRLCAAAGITQADLRGNT